MVPPTSPAVASPDDDESYYLTHVSRYGIHKPVVFTARQHVELFHLVFLRALVARGEDKGLFALKGGVLHEDIGGDALSVQKVPVHAIQQGHCHAHHPAGHP